MIYALSWVETTRMWVRDQFCPVKFHILMHLILRKSVRNVTEKM